MAATGRHGKRLRPNGNSHYISKPHVEAGQQTDARFGGARLSRGGSGRGACYMYVTARGDSCETATEVVVIDKKQKPISSESLNSKRYR